MKENKINVVCDTNIWYNIAEGKIQEKEYNNYNLIGTYINILELATSPAMLEKPEIWKKAVDGFFYHCQKFRTYDYFEYIKKESGLPFKMHSYIDAMRDLRIIRNYHLDNSSENLIKLHKLKDEQKLEIIDVMNQIDNIRTNLYEDYKYYIYEISKPERKEIHLEITKELIVTITRVEKINWENVSLFLHTFDQWLFQLVKIRNLKIKNNDWQDLINLVYVKPGEYYWTKDEKKTKEYIHTSGHSSYLIH